MKNESKTEPTSADSTAKVKKKSDAVNIDDPAWKIPARNRAAELAIMKRTTFPEKLNLEPVNGQKVIQFVLIIAILTVICFVCLFVYYNMFMGNKMRRRAAYIHIYKAVHSSRMTTFDQSQLKDFRKQCPGMYTTDWTPWRLALRPQSEMCPACHKVVMIRSRVIVAREPPDRGKQCPATIEWSELDQDKYGDMVFDGQHIKTAIKQ